MPGVWSRYAVVACIIPCVSCTAVIRSFVAAASGEQAHLQDIRILAALPASCVRIEHTLTDTVVFSGSFTYNREDCMRALDGGNYYRDFGVPDTTTDPVYNITWTIPRHQGRLGFSYDISRLAMLLAEVGGSYGKGQLLFDVTLGAGAHGHNRYIGGRVYGMLTLKQALCDAHVARSWPGELFTGGGGVETHTDSGSSAHVQISVAGTVNPMRQNPVVNAGLRSGLALSIPYTYRTAHDVARAGFLLFQATPFLYRRLGPVTPVLGIDVLLDMSGKDRNDNSLFVSAFAQLDVRGNPHDFARQAHSRNMR